MKHKLLTLFLALATSVGTIFADINGTCGEDLYWSFDYSTGILSITGTGTMENYGGKYSDSPAPWHSYSSYIRTISLPSGLQNIGKYAFDCCHKLTSVVIPEGVTTIGEGAFSICLSLPSVTIPLGVTSIGNEAFLGDSSLNFIAIPNSLKVIRPGTFQGCKSLKFIDIPNSVTSIGDNAFQNCTSLTSIDIPNSVTKIGSNAFLGCGSLTSVFIPNSVTSIGAFAFQNCSSLTSIEIPDIEISIGGSAFQNCSFTSVTIPKNVTYLGVNAFFSCDSLKEVTLNANAIVSKEYSSSYSLKNIFGMQVETYVLGESVTEIGYCAFNGCNSMTSVIIPNGVTSIGSSAFKDCTGLTSVTIPESVTSIDSKSFSGCSSLTTITLNSDAIVSKAYSQFSPVSILFGEQVEKYILGENITRIGEYAFQNSTSLTSVTIPESVTSIGSYAFNSCSSLTSITIPGSIISIGSGTFEGCSSLTTVSIPESVTSIDGSTFQNCSSLTSIEIPNSVTSIGKNAFLGCSSLTSVTIPNSVTFIGDGAFSGCSSLTSIAIPESVSVIDDGAFFDCSSLTEVYISDIAAWCNINFVYALANPLYYAHKFYVNKELVTDLIIPESVTSIGASAFFNCSNLTSVTIPNSMTSIGGSAFQNCSSLTSVTIPNNVTSIKGGAFFGCTNLVSIAIGNSVTSIESDAFYDCNNLTKVTLNSNAIVNNTYSMRTIFGEQVEEYILGENVTDIGEYAFYYCNNLTSVTISNSVTNIGNNAFESCGSLTSIAIPESVSTIGDNAFNDCNSLTSVTICDGVTTISESAFKNCRGLTSVTIPRSVISIGSNAFNDCNSLTSVTILEGVTTIGESAFQNCSRLTSIAIPNSVTSIGVRAFNGCSSLKSITIPESVTSIDVGTFALCRSLTSITIPNSVTSIDNSAFYGCNNLNTIHAQMEIPPVIDASVFADCGDLSGIDCYVPQASLELYQNADVWKEFNLIAENKNNLYTLSVNANNPLYGCVTGSGDYGESIDVEIAATPNAGYHFVCWNDGNQSATRTVTVSSDATYTALFAADVVPQEEVVTVYTEQTTATITAELIDNDDVESYRFVIYYQGAVFCTCLLDKDGQTLQVDYADNEPNSIPTRLNMPAEALNEANGLNISVSDLQRCATYQFTLDALDADGNILDRRENDFTTTGSVETTDGITVWDSELPYTWEGITFTTAGTETKTLTASTGCDSIVTFTLNVKYHDITLQDNADTDYYTQFAEDYNGHTVNTATLNRQFTQDKWSTLCLPFNVSKSLMIALGLSGRVYEFRYAEQSDDESIQMYFASAQSIEAGKGYIVNANAKLAQKTSFVFPNVTIDTDADNGDITALTGYNDNSGRGNLYLAGTLRAGVLQGSANGNTYLGLKDNKLYYPNSTSGTAIRAYRGFFRCSEPMTAQRVRIVLDGEGMGELIIDNGQLTMDNEQPVRKYIENGIIYIRCNGKTYNAQGLRID